MQKLSGGCSCGAVKYQVTGDPKSIINCHCNMCRKMNGAAFSTYVAVADEQFEVLNGELKKHRVSENAEKHFCSACGTPIYNSSLKYAGLTILHLGSLDTELKSQPQANIYCESRLDWLDAMPDMASKDRGF